MRCFILVEESAHSLVYGVHASEKLLPSHYRPEVIMLYIYIYLLCFLERFVYNSHLISIILKIMLISLMKINVKDESS